MNNSTPNLENRKNLPSIFPLFSKPLYCKKLNPLAPKLKQDLLNVDLVPTKEGSGYASLDNKILDRSEFNELLINIQNEINFYVYKVLNVSTEIKFKIISSWIMVHTDKVHKAQSHVHSGSVLSGCFYIQAPAKCGNINFTHYEGAHTLRALPFPFYFNFTKKNIYNSSSWTFQVEDNLLLIFPSDIPHSTEGNLSGESRYCLAFDVVPEGEFVGSLKRKIKLIYE